MCFENFAWLKADDEILMAQPDQLDNIAGFRINRIVIHDSTCKWVEKKSVILL